MVPPGLRLHTTLSLLASIIRLSTTVSQSDSTEATYYATVGQQAVVPCTTTVDQPVDFGFQFHQETEIRDIFHGGQIVNGQAIRYELKHDSSNNFKLIIFKATLNDSGIYICTERSGIGIVHRIRLHVTDTQEATYYATVGQQAVVPCTTTVDQPVDFGFQFHQEAEIRDIYHGGNIVNGQAIRYALRPESPDGSKTFKLIIFEATLNDSGIYICTERAGIGIVHRIRLNVTEAARQHFPLSASSDTIVADIGQSIKLPCRCSLPVGVDWTFVSSPAADHVHICQNGQLVDGHSANYYLDKAAQGDYNLVIRKVSATDAGTYVCTEGAGSGPQHSITLIAAKPQKSQVEVVGKTATLVCLLGDSRTPIRWHYYRPGSKVRRVIYNGQEVTDSSVRHSVFVNEKRSALVISDIRLSDGGLYECNPVSSAVVKKTFELTVLEYEPSCDIYPSYEVIEYQDVEVRCDLSYSGNLKPNLLCSPNSQNASLTKTVFGITAAAKIGSTCMINDANVMCVVKFTSEADSETSDYFFSWKSTERLRVSGSCSGQTAVHQQQDAMNQFALIAIVALVVAVLAVVAVVTVVILLIRPTLFKCCKRRQRTADSDQRTRNLFISAKSARSASTTSKLNCEKLESECLQPMLANPRTRHYFIEDKDADIENNKNQTLVQQTITTPPTYKYFDSTEPGNTVRGISELGGRLYVARSDQKKIEIYNTQTMKLIADESLELCDSDPWCMASCKKNESLYISFKLTSKIQKLVLGDASEKFWKTNSPPDGISVTPEATLLVAFRAANELVEFNTDGKEIRKIELPCAKPRHAISLGSDIYLVCYGVYNEEQRGLAEVIATEKPFKHRRIDSNLDHPLHLAVHSRCGFVVVADYNGKKVVMLDSKLNYAGDVNTVGDPQVDTPFMLCFDEHCQVLYVADHGADHRVFAFNVCFSSA